MGFKKRMRNDVRNPANNKRSTNVLRSNPAIDFRYATPQFDPMSGQSKNHSKCTANPLKAGRWVLAVQPQIFDLYFPYKKNEDTI